MFRPVSIATLLLGIVMLVLACNDLTLPSQALPKFIIVQGGDRQTGEVGTPLPDSLLVRVIDGTGRPVEGVVVRFVPRVPAVDGQAIPDSTWTDADGRATARWLLGPRAGPLQLAAETKAGSGGEPLAAPLAAMARAGPPALIRAFRGDGQSAQVGSLLHDSLIALVTDRFGNPLPGQSVVWHTADGAVSDSVTTTDPGGRAGVVWLLGQRAGAQLTQATSGGLSGSPVGFGAMGLPGPATAVLKAFGDSQVAPVGAQLTDSVVVQIVDGFGNGVAGRSVSWVVTGGGGSVVPATGTTDASGRAFCHWTLGPGSGIQGVSAVAAGLNQAGFTAVALSQPPALLQAASATALVGQAGQPVIPPPSVRVLDGNANPVPGVTVTFSVRHAGGQVSNRTTTGSSVTVSTDLSGVASLTAWTLASAAGIDTVAASAVGPGGQLSGSPLLFIAFGLPGPAARLAFLAQPGTTTAGRPVVPPVTVAVEDQNGNLASGFTGTVTLSLGSAPPGGTLNGTTVAGVAGGIATFGGLTLPKAGTGYTLAASSQPPAAPATSDSFTVIPGAAAVLVVATQPSDTAISGGRLVRQPVVRLEDGLGNRVTQSNVPVTTSLAAGGGTLGGTVTVTTTTGGVATFTDLAVSGLTGTRALTFSAPGLPTVTSTPIILLAGPAAILTLAAGGSQTANVGTTVAVPPAVRVTDQSGNPVAGVTVGFAVTSGGGSLTGSTAVTNTLGIASVGSWRMGPIRGSNTITATAAGLTGSPLTISATGRFADLAVRGGADFSCGVTTAGTPYCWGRNNAGQVGNGGSTNQLAPVLVAGGLLFQAIGLGDTHACGLTAAGAAYCWGANGNGRLGDGTTTNSPTPVAVAGGLAFVTIEGGRAHTCALTAARAAYCWGQNNRGQLGDGTVTARLTPVPVAGGIAFRALGLGVQFSCGVATSGTVYCWGLNGTGQLGDGTKTDRSTPTAVAGTGWSAIAVGDNFACALGAGGAASCWGGNAAGQLGDGTTADHLAPVPVSGGLGFSRLDAGSAHACGLRASGAILCWGLNADGELGDGTTTNRQVPTTVQGGAAFASVNAGALFTLALTPDGAAYGWGRNATGQLGTGNTTAMLTPTPVAVP